MPRSSSRGGASPAEEQGGRPKTIERRVYGRVGFELLRHGVLAAA